MAPKKLKSSRTPETGHSVRNAGPPSTLDTARRTGKPLLLFALAALASSASQLSLSPVYGSIPSGVNHKAALAWSLAVAYLFRLLLPHYDRTVARYLPTWSLAMFVLQFLPFHYSEQLGLVAGPLVTSLLSCYLVVIPIVYVAAAALEAAISFKGYSRLPVAAVQTVLAGLYFNYLTRTLSTHLPDLMTLSPHLNPFNLQLLITASLTLLLPLSTTLLSLTPLILTALLALTSPYGSGPYSMPFLTHSLAPQNWTLLARHWSTTGYLSVLQNNDLSYRVLRCDHSLLGGEWLLTPSRLAEKWRVPESIYAVFQMLEAVRLVLPLPGVAPVPDNEASALVIGLGIGTAPAALLAHGITTTILELDPLVHAYATTYFHLPANHTAHLTNAIPWVASRAASLSNPPSPPVEQYNYILHDVFTGGAEPLPLFTTTFLTNLRLLLKPNGVAALNYAGDLSLPLTGRILNTIDSVFGRQCSLYRDAAPAPDSEQDFSNFVVFCRNPDPTSSASSPPSSEPVPIEFRQPVAADFLQSYGRKSHLFPRPDQRVEFPLRGTERGGEVLRDEDVGGWRRQQEESARRHWRIMRTVVPGGVWEWY